ncbi:histidine--tRNA ligase [bacterium]|nr:histidine--tRNA ligase [bacterium]
MNKISNQAPKGTIDWLPEEFSIRLYIFKTWIKVCESYGYDRYLTPVLENADIYRAKSGDEVGGKELMILEDRAGREYALRPEMTPSVVRLVSKIYDKYPKPIRFFSVANFFRNEKPQRGRNREFWQLNCDIFGSESINAEKEILQLATDLVLSFKPPKNSFTVYINNRKLIDGFLSGLNISKENKISVVRLMDKWGKVKEDDLLKSLKDLGLKDSDILSIKSFMSLNNLEDLVSNYPDLKENEGFKELEEIMNYFKETKYSEYIEFNPKIIRGLDYYDGLIFEIFDNNKDNNRAMFGGGRYNGLADIFGKKSFPAVGFAPGDETTKLFLESWDLLKNIPKKEKYYIPLLSNDLVYDVNNLVEKLRKEDEEKEEKMFEVGLNEQKLNKALQYANGKGIDKVIILGEDEKKKGVYKIKDMNTGREVEFDL